MLIEAGPDYGSFGQNSWPSDLLDSKALPSTHQWGYHSGTTYGDRVVNFERARVIGGCSSHNGCAAIWGSSHDYDDWAAAGNEGWAASDLIPLFKNAMDRMRVRNYEESEVTPFHKAFLEAATQADIPRTSDLNDLWSDVGAAPFPANVVAGTRWNSSFAFLDPVRDQPNLSIVGNSLVDRVVIDRTQVSGVVATVAEHTVTLRGDRVILCAGTYGSPAILLRSGIGPTQKLRQADVDVVLERPGVGENLHDHPTVTLRFSGTPSLEAATRLFASERLAPEEQTIAKAQSSHCKKAFDLHLCPIGGPDPEYPQTWRWTIMVACMDPLSRGELQLRSSHPSEPPLIDHRYLTDEGRHDVLTLASGVELARRVASFSPLAQLVGREIGPLGDGGLPLEWAIPDCCAHYYHPVGTCKMGLASDKRAVVDSMGRVHGLEGLYVADCSLAPVVPRANTAIPAVVIGLKIAHDLLRAAV